MIQFACPYCFAELPLDSLKCPRCYFQGEVLDGIYHLHRTDDTWELCLEQLEAKKKSAAAAACKIRNDPAPAKPPDTYPVDLNHKMQDKIVELLGGIKECVFLDIGGVNRWATKRFLEAGAALGVDININVVYLSKSEENALSVVGDGYYLPFANEQFDFVFDCSSLHHFLYKGQLLSQIYRVLKKGGHYMSQGNPSNAEGGRAEEERYWKSFGLIETQPTAAEYESLFMNSPFKNVSYIPVDKNMIMQAEKS